MRQFQEQEAEKLRGKQDQVAAKERELKAKRDDQRMKQKELAEAK